MIVVVIFFFEIKITKLLVVQESKFLSKNQQGTPRNLKNVQGQLSRTNRYMPQTSNYHGGPTGQTCIRKKFEMYKKQSPVKPMWHQ